MHRILLVVLILLGASCANIPKEQKQQLKATATTYRQVERGTPRAIIEQRFGAPVRADEDGSQVWETRYNERNYVQMKVWFDAEDRAQRLTITRSRGVNAPGYRAESVFSWDK